MTRFTCIISQGICYEWS